MKELRKAVRDALERMEAAHKAVEDAGEDADLEALNAEFETAEAEHRSAVQALEAGEEREERAKRVAEARKAAPVEPVEPEDDPADEPQTRTAGGVNARVGKEPLTYERGNGFSVFGDLARAQIESDPEARARLDKHKQEMRVLKRAHPSQTAGEGGEFIAPVWMQDEWIKLPRAGRAVADSLNRKAYPGKVNQLNLPKVSTGTATERQSSDGSAVKSEDLTTTSVTGQAQTIAGQQDVSMQLVELSNPGIDEVIFDDLGRDYNQRVDVLCINSSVSNAKGLLQLSGTNEVTFTQATPTLPLLYPKVANAIQKINTGIFRTPTVVAMHPRRWAFCLAALDTANRPLITPYAGQNSAAKIDRVAAEAVVGEIQGIPVIVDANIPTNEGASTNQDSILVYSADDLYLFEDETPKLRVMSEVLSNTLQVRFQIWNYVILIAGRLPKAISKIQGTGLAEPTF